MSATARDLKYYLANPDEMPTDVKEIERLTAEMMEATAETGTEQLTVDRFVPPDEKKEGVASDAKAEEKPEAKPEAKAEVPAEEAKAEKPTAEAEVPAEVKPEGILAKDGKNLIPYSQLESARARAASAEALAKTQAEELERLKAEKAAPQGEAAEVEMLSEDELKALEADSPTLAKTLRSLQTAIAKQSEKLQQIDERQHQQVASEEAVVKSEIQTAIDLNPTLAAWQADKDQTMWNEASRFDRVLRESPKYADVSFADRFAKVVELTQSALGQEAQAPKQDAPAPTQEEIKAAAAAKLKAKPSTPRSLSDIPGGAPPAVDERDKVEQMSAVALGAMFQSMTAEQREAYLAGL